MHTSAVDDGGPGLRRPAALSPRDLELLRHLAAGRSTAQVARAMKVSSNTVRTRVRRVAGKLQVDGRAQIVPRTRQLGLI